MHYLMKIDNYNSIYSKYTVIIISIFIIIIDFFEDLVYNIREVQNKQFKKTI